MAASDATVSSLIQALTSMPAQNNAPAGHWNVPQLGQGQILKATMPTLLPARTNPMFVPGDGTGLGGFLTGGGSGGGGGGGAPSPATTGGVGLGTTNPWAAPPGSPPADTTRTRPGIQPGNPGANGGLFGGVQNTGLGPGIVQGGANSENPPGPGLGPGIVQGGSSIENPMPTSGLGAGTVQGGDPMGNTSQTGSPNRLLNLGALAKLMGIGGGASAGPAAQTMGLNQSGAGSPLTPQAGLPSNPAARALYAVQHHLSPTSIGMSPGDFNKMTQGNTGVFQGATYDPSIKDYRTGAGTPWLTAGTPFSQISPDQWSQWMGV